MSIEHLTTNGTYTVNINIFSYKNPWGKQLLKNSNAYKQNRAYNLEPTTVCTLIIIKHKGILLLSFPVPEIRCFPPLLFAKWE